MLKKYILIFFTALFTGLLSAHGDSTKRVVIPDISPALRFTENIGQWDDFIRYRMQLDGGYLYFEKDGLTYSFYDKKKVRAVHYGGLYKGLSPEIKFHAVKIKFLGADPNSGNQASEKGTDYENFFL